MRRMLLGLAIAVVAIAATAVLIVPAAGGPRPVMTSSADCREIGMRLRSTAAVEATSRKFTWGSESYGWGCVVHYADGSSSSVPAEAVQLMLRQTDRR